MRNFLLITILFLCCCTGFSQNYSQYNKAYFSVYSTFNHLPIRHEIKKNEPQIVYQIENTQKGTSKRYIKKFDSNGNMTHLQGFDEKDRLISEIIVTYANGKIQSYSKYSRYRLEEAVRYEWNDLKKMTLLEVRNRRNKVVNKNIWTFNSDNCLASSISYKNGKEKINKQWTYDYYSACNKSKSTLKNGKGKILKEWTFACKEEGEELKKKKKTSQICKWQALDENYIIYVHQTFDQKGRVIKNITKANRSDSTMVEYKSFNHKDELIYHATYLNSAKKPLHTISYHRNKIHYSNIYEYENDLIVSQESSYKNKYKTTRKFQYNAYGNLISVKTFNKNKSMVSYTTLTYPE